MMMIPPLWLSSQSPRNVVWEGWSQEEIEAVDDLVLAQFCQRNSAFVMAEIGGCFRVLWVVGEMSSVNFNVKPPITMNDSELLSVSSPLFVGCHLCDVFWELGKEINPSQGITRTWLLIPCSVIIHIHLLRQRNVQGTSWQVETSTCFCLLPHSLTSFLCRIHN